MGIDSFVSHMMARGISSNLASRIGERFTDWEALNSADTTDFSAQEIDQIKRAKTRKAITREVILRLVTECEFKCCLCWNIDSDSGVVIHHIHPHASVPDDRYENLILLCSDHHDKVHTVRELTRQPFPPELLVRRKTDFIAAIADFRKGKRCAPGRESNSGSGEFPVVPALPSHFCGRDDIVKDIVAELKSGTNRIALLGMGGVGKTTIALAIASECRSEFLGGILWADASAERNSISLMIRNWIKSLGGDPESIENDQHLPFVLGLLASWTKKHGKLLLLIDNVDIAALDELTVISSQITPDAAFLITLRDATVATALDTTQFLIEPLDSLSCIKILKDVSGSKQFEGMDEAIERLLLLIGNLPIAAELVARQIAIRERKPGFSIGKLCDRLENFDAQLLSFPGHRGVARSFALSFESLGQSERTSFISFGVLASGSIFTNDVATIIGENESSTEDSLDRLVIVSMLSWGESAGVYRIHALLHKYSKFLLEQQADPKTNHMQVSFYKHFTSMAKLFTDDSHKNLDKIEQIFPNLEKAIHDAYAHGDFSVLTETMMHLYVQLNYFTARNFDKESIPLLEIAITASKKLKDQNLECALTGSLGTAYNRLGRIKDAVKHYEAAIRIAKQIRSNYDLASNLQNLALTLLSEANDITRVEKLLEESMVVAELSENIDALMGSLSALAYLRKEQGALIEAAELYSKAIKVSQLIKSRLSEGNNLSNLGLVLAQQGNEVDGEKLINKAITIAQEIGDRRGEGNRTGHIGGILMAKAMRLGPNPEGLKIVKSAKEKVQIALDIAQETGDIEKAGGWLMNLANIHSFEGEVELATKILKETIDVGVSGGFRRIEAQSRYNLGSLLARTERLHDALHQFTLAKDLLIAMESPLANQADAYINRLRVLLNNKDSK